MGLYWGCFAAYVPVLKAQIGASDALFGIVLLGSATGLVSSMWLAPRADRALGARAMQVGAVLLLVAWMLPGYATLPLMFAVVMSFVGLASGLLDVVMNARVSELEAQHGRSLMNFNHAMFSLAYGVGALAAGAAREADLPVQAVMLMLGVLTVLAMPFMRQEVRHVAPQEGYSGRYPLMPIVVCGAIVLTAFMSEATVEAWSALHVERTLGGGAAEGALGPAMLGLTMALGRLSGQAIAERLHEIPVIVAGGVLAAFGAVIAATAPDPGTAYLGFGILGLGVSVVGPMGLAMVGRLVPPHLRTEAIARAAVISYSGFFLAPSLSGFISQAYGLRTVFWAIALLLLRAVPLALALRRMPAYGAR